MSDMSSYGDVWTCLQGTTFGTTMRAFVHIDAFVHMDASVHEFVYDTPKLTSSNELQSTASPCSLHQQITNHMQNSPL